MIDLSSINTSDVISVLKEEISDFDVKMTAVDEGSLKQRYVRRAGYI